MAPVAREPPSSQRSSSSSPSSSSSSHGGSLEPFFSSSPAIAKKQQQRKRPIIRVVHVFAPKLVQTDTANFRTLVQNLTGNKARLDLEKEIEAHLRKASCAVDQTANGIDHLGAIANHEEIRILESSKHVLKNKGKSRESSCLDDLETDTERRKNQAILHREGGDELDLLMSRNCSTTERDDNSHGDDANNSWAMASFNDSDEISAKSADYFETGKTVDDRIDCFFAWDADDDAEYANMSCPSNSSCSTFLQSPLRPLESKPDAFDDERIHGFHHPQYFSMQSDGYQLFT